MEVNPMKALILCGGRGTRIRDVSEVLPKPMLNIGEKPMLWHIMKIYAHYGIKDFVLCLGYKGWTIKEFFLNYSAKTSDITVSLNKKNSIIHHSQSGEEDWNVTLAETGEFTQTGARIYNARNYLEDCEEFCVTYGDGVADIDIGKLLKTHRDSGLLGTVTAVYPSGRFGEMEMKGNMISEFDEKPNVSTGSINGGFMVFNRGVIDRYFREGDDLILESEVLPKMVKDKQLGAYKHSGFWQCIDTSREYDTLNEMWKGNKAAWNIWDK